MASHAAWSQVAAHGFSVKEAADGELSISCGDHSLVLSDYFWGVALGASKVTPGEDGQSFLLERGTQGGAYFRRQVTLKQGEAIVAYSLDAPGNVKEWELGLYLAEPLFTKQGTSFGTAYGQVADEPLMLQYGSAKGTWWLQDHRKTPRKAWRLVTTNYIVGDATRFRGVVRLVVGKGVKSEPLVDLGAPDYGNLEHDLSDLTDLPYTLLLSRNRRWCNSGEKVSVHLRYLSPDNAKRIVSGRWTLTNESGGMVQRAPFKFGAAGSANKTLTFAPKENRAYRLAVEYEQGGKTVTRETSFTVLPRIRVHGSAPDSIFGAAVSGTDYLCNVSRAMGVKWNRRHCSMGDTSWSLIVPEEGRPDFADADRACDMERRYGMLSFGTFSEGPPAWVKDRAARLFKDDFDGYCDLVINGWIIPTVKHFAGRIDHWEVNNEPYYPYWGREKDYAKYLGRVYAAIKRANPKAKVIGMCGPPKSMSFSWFFRTWKAGCYDHQDIVSGHFYPWGRMAPGAEVVVRQWIKDLRALMRDFGKEKPFWNSETSVSPCATLYQTPERRAFFTFGDTEKPGHPRDQAAFMAKQLIIHVAEKVKYSFHLFSYSPENFSHPFDYDGTPLAMAVSWTACARELEKATLTCEVTNHKPLQGFIFGRRDATVATLWGTDFQRGETADLTFKWPGPMEVRDLFDNPLGSKAASAMRRVTLSTDPVYLLTSPGTAKSLREALSAGRLTVKKTLESVKPVLGTPLQRATPKDWTGFSAVDLSKFVNRSFTDEEVNDGKGGWTDEGINDLRNLPDGEFIVNEVPFVILDPGKSGGRSCLVLAGNLRPSFPGKVEGILVNARFDKLHFLHLTTYGSGNVPIRYVLHYTDGSIEEIPIQGQKQIADWYIRTALPEAKIAWRGPNPVTDEVTVWQTEWKSPRKAHEVIKTMDIVSEKTAVPVVIAITGSHAN
ncbi:MAG: hypothetical protein HY318_06775 [Armatimonadetes bacterium]|nr:hypothetical protein [Armatimonadota bacterium]